MPDYDFSGLTNDQLKSLYYKIDDCKRALNNILDQTKRGQYQSSEKVSNFEIEYKIIQELGRRDLEGKHG